MSDLLRTVAAYVPLSLVHEALNSAAPKPPTEPRTERFPAAVLFADVSGFTPLTEALGQKGSEGPEELTRLLNRYFSWMISFIEAEGGEVVKFGGDALTVVFSAKEESLGSATRRAMQAAETMQLAMQEFGIMESSAGLVTLKMKIGIGAGEILSALVGGIDDRWEYIIAGDPLRQIAQAENRAKKGEIVLSPEAEAIIAPYVLPMQPLPQVDWESVQNPAAVERVLRCYTPKPIRTWLDEGLHGWLATLRPMSVLFVGVNGLDYEQSDVIERLHAFLRGAQKIIYHYQGSLPRLTVGDKGTVLLVLFGSPPYSHEDDPERALRCALDMQNLAEHHNLTLAIGVTTGRVFAGPVGSHSRREYTVMGDAVNLAARLMIEAGPGRVYCNYETYRSTYGQMSFESLPPVEVKGKAGFIPIYRPTGDNYPRWQLDQINQAEITEPLIGRETEMARLASTLDKVEAGHSRVIIIEGEAGIGKSKLVEALIRLMQERGMAMLLGMGRSIEQDTPYRVWQDIFGAYFDLNNITDTAPAKQTEQQQQVQAHISRVSPDLLEHIPLLNDILNLGLPENELTTSLNTSQRQENLTSLLLALLQARAAQKSMGLILENAQWLDPPSWKLAVRVAQGLMKNDLPLALVLVMRPLEGNATHAGAKILSNRDKIERLRLDTLPPEETLTLAVMSLGLTGNELPEAVAELVRVRASGNPFFAEELFYYLYDNGFITFKVIKDQTRCLINNDLERAAQTLPATIESVILARIDQLPPEKQLMLKVAAVIGHTFTYNTLCDTLGKHMEIDKKLLRDYLDDLIHLDFIRPEEAESNQTYRFKHIIIREVTYESLPFDRRRQLHRTVAMWYEATFGQAEQQETQNGKETIDFSDDPLALHFPASQFLHPFTSLAPYYSLLVYHWHQAEDDEREQYYASLLGRQAVAQFANAEAVGYINRALDLTPETNLVGRYNLLLARETVYDRQGQREVQRQDLATLTKLVKDIKNDLRRVVVALRQANYAEATSNYSAALAAAQQAVAQAKQAKDWVGEGKGYTMWGKILLRQGNYRAAQEILEQALNLTRAGSNRYDEAGSLYTLANAYWHQGNYSAALDCCKEALEICRAGGYRLIEAHNLNMCGLIYYQLGNYLIAQEHFEQAISIYYAIGDQRGELQPFYNIGLTYLNMNNYEAARDYFEYALNIAQDIGEREGAADILSNLGLTYCKLGDYTAARSYLGQSLGIRKEIDNHVGEADSLSKLGFVYYSLDDSRTTKRYCDLALDIQQKIGDRKGESYSLTYLGHALTEQGQLQAATTAYNRVLQLYHEMEQTVPAIDAIVGLAYINMAQDNSDQALAQIEKILAWIETNGTVGIDNLFWVYLKSYHVLNATAQGSSDIIKRAQATLTAAYTALQKQAARLSDKTLQYNFLENIKIHRDIIAIKEGRESASQKHRKHPGKESSQLLYV